MQLTTLPVYSKLADPSDIPVEIAARLPEDWHLSQHQLETYAALRSADVDVVINTAMTGDGKSLAGLLPLIAHWSEAPTLALYPANELIQDQYRSIEDLFPQWGRQADRAATLYGAKLDELAAVAESLTRPETMRRELVNRLVVLSNPDILHAILQFHYQQFGRAATWLTNELNLNFQQLTFDEFHIFDAAQITAVLTGLLFLHEQNRSLKTLFLSATPDQRLIVPLRRVGFGDRLRIISPQQEGWYRHGEDPGQGWRCILQACQLTLAQQSAEEWMAEGLERVLLPWFRDRPHGVKAAIIVNSVATALRLEQLLRPHLEPRGLRVAPNTRLNGQSTRKASYEADVLIGTSTVDVGVDFRINLLIFEASSAGTFLQRLGRLGRHTHYKDRDGALRKFQDFAAYALVPSFVYERLTMAKDGQPPLLKADDVMNRQLLGEQITAVYPEPANFKHYARIWGRFQAAKVYEALLGKSKTTKKVDRNLQASFAPVRERLQRRYYDLTGANVGKAVQEADQYRHDGLDLLVQEAQSFRGGSPFECGVLKDGENDPITYNLFWLLANAQLEPISQKAFCTAVGQMQRSTTPFERDRHVAFFRWRGLRAQTELVTVLLGAQVSAWSQDKLMTAQVLPGIRLEVNGHNDLLNDLNDQLAHRKVVGLLVPGYSLKQLRSEIYLPGIFTLHPYCDENGLQGCIAFGRYALLLDSVLRHRKLRAANDGPFFA